jgi:hypothetical protein
VFFFEDNFLHFIMVTSKTKKRKSAIETISEKMEKSGKIGEKVDFFRGGCVKAPTA